jgi:hypothetical protein
MISILRYPVLFLSLANISSANFFDVFPAISYYLQFVYIWAEESIGLGYLPPPTGISEVFLP